MTGDETGADTRGDAPLVHDLEEARAARRDARLASALLRENRRLVRLILEVGDELDRLRRAADIRRR